MGIIYETGLGVFLILLCALGGSAAWMTGRAAAYTWRPLWRLCWFLFLLSVAIRFLTFALFDGTLLSLHYLLVDYVVLLAFGLAGWRYTRTSQMTTQYVWLYEKTGPFTWRLRDGASDRYAEG
ncbi:hypothetical protein FMN50_27290 [Rhodobacterales bacterium]|nr:hypothetical protein FMN50_27290 [Rhodobacterales bacterium]